MQFSIHTFVLLVLTMAAGYAMVVAGLGKNALELRRRKRVCPSCGRRIETRVCVCSS